MKKCIQFGSKRIEFDLEFKHRKSLGITVTPEMEVIVKAPYEATLDHIIEIIRKRAPWILKQQSYFNNFFPKQPPKKYVSGETHLYLGRRYLLKIQYGKRQSVQIKNKYINVICYKKDKVEHLIKEWYLYRAEIKFSQYLKNLLVHFEKYKVQPNSLVVREMPKRWGSCTKNGKIILNTELIKAPKGCIEYVIIHELCHLLHYNHTKKFVDLQNKIMPDWEKWKVRLENLLA